MAQKLSVTLSPAFQEHFVFLINLALRQLFVFTVCGIQLL